MLIPKYRAWDTRCSLHIGTDYPQNWSRRPEDMDDVYGNIDRIEVVSIQSASTRDHLILEQSTGIHDTAGREIYEGDILRVDYLAQSFNAIVERDTENPCMVLHLQGHVNYSEYEYDFSKCRMMRHTIIGNIHEHPNVLEPWSFCSKNVPSDWNLRFPCSCQNHDLTQR